MVALEELDDIAFLHGRGRLHPLAVELYMASPAGFGGVAAAFEEADVLEPVIDSMSVHNRI